MNLQDIIDQQTATTIYEKSCKDYCQYSRIARYVSYDEILGLVKMLRNIDSVIVVPITHAYPIIGNIQYFCHTSITAPVALLDQTPIDEIRKRLLKWSKKQEVIPLHSLRYVKHYRKWMISIIHGNSRKLNINGEK